MTDKEFEIKYNDYLSEGHYGLSISNPEIINIVDKYFNELITIPGFKFHQIKEKFNSARVYTNLYNLGYIYLSRTIEGQIEKEINAILNKKD